MRAMLSVAAVVAATSAQGQVLVTGDEGCVSVERLMENGPYRALDELLLTTDTKRVLFDFETLTASDYTCRVEPAFDFALKRDVVQTRIGHCREAGPTIRPAVFSLTNRGDGRILLGSSIWAEPLVLSVCY